MSAIFLINDILQDTQAWHDCRKRGIGESEAETVRPGRKGADKLLSVKMGKG